MIKLKRLQETFSVYNIVYLRYEKMSRPIIFFLKNEKRKLATSELLVGTGTSTYNINNDDDIDEDEDNV